MEFVYAKMQTQIIQNTEAYQGGTLKPFSRSLTEARKPKHSTLSVPSFEVIKFEYSLKLKATNHCALF